MKLKVAKSDLAEGVKTVMGAVAGRTTIPALNCLLFKAENGKMSVFATDLECSLLTAFPAEIEEPGLSMLPSKKISQIVKGLPVDEVQIETDASFRTKIRCARSSFNLVGLDPSEMPAQQDMKEGMSMTVSGKVFRGDLDKVVYAASHDESRMALTGVLVSVRNKILTVVSTDGRRLSMVERTMGGADFEIDAILPPKLVALLSKTLKNDGDLRIDIVDELVGFTQGDTCVRSRQLAGQFPNFRQVIPTEFNLTAVVARQMFLSVVERVSLVTNDMSPMVTLSIAKDAIKVSAIAAEVGEGTETVDAQTNVESAVDITFNPQYLMDPLRTTESDQITISFNDAVSPVMISDGDGLTYVLMPLRK